MIYDVLSSNLTYASKNFLQKRIFCLRIHKLQLGSTNSSLFLKKKVLFSRKGGVKMSLIHRAQKLSFISIEQMEAALKTFLFLFN